MTKILTLIGSYRKNGNTTRVVNLLHDRLLESAARAGQSIEIETVHLGDLSLRPCRGCRACFDRGEEHCPQHFDELPALAQQMHAADALIIATPVYVNDVSGLVKTWMDRLAYACHRPQFHGKMALLVATVGTGIFGYTFDVLAAGLISWGYVVSGKLGIAAGALTPQADLAAKHGKRIQRAADALLKDLRAERYNRPGLRALVTFAVQQIVWRSPKHAGTLDEQYWNAQGWTDPRMAYYHPIQVAPLTLLLARAAGKLIARFITS